ncbi:hypothetical protein CHLNCDRAFT_56574 [Chlorella variabilis]|uniref:Uncharacterized protein n=1 Tax=Chlorella variabilis TaxID=554065 RepID=E1Z367_CHLVA|nr:hypothetical protein CHLNCDRAFT_56574 [Chlorella variabilis]EFN59785.1 hypothetical protein CHLNCDRAFT_56574 [Chlorella variabilis]|eukprot:XP_005851887.1 hypothetical protein CHLNCDRAFT_56574 [Chlorella variabilis]
MDSLGPLRARAAQLTAAAQREKAAAVQTYETSARPALKEHAASLKESLGILMREEAALQERVDALASRAVAGADPSVRTGFNVIRARTGADGQSLPTEELRAERQRLVDTLDVLGQQVEQAKVEITRHAGRGRHQEQEIWETQLVALQDTKRVYRDEINLIEVELLGRQHAERVAAERAAAEASGAAQLQRLQEQLLQTRVKYNRAKYQYYYPGVKGYTINFGGGGIFGACKNIDISEINGFVTLRGEPGGMAPDGTVTRPARLIMQFEGPQAHRPQAQGAALRAQLSRKSSHLATSSSFRTGGSAAAAASTPPSPSPLRPAPSGSASKQQEDGSLPTSRSAASGGSSRPPMLPPQRPAAVLPPKPPLQDRVGTLRGGAGSLETRSIPDSAVSMDSAGSAELLEQAAAAANSRSQSRSQLGAATQEQHQVPSPGKEQKGKNAALRFLSRLGKKKDKYQSKERGGLLQPAASQDIEAAAGKEGKRTLAGKLMNRSKARLGSGDVGSSISSLERLAFGSHQLSQDTEHPRPRQEAIDEEEASLHSDSVVGEDDAFEAGQQQDGSSAHHPVEVHDEGDGSLASDDDSDDEVQADGKGPNSPLTHDVLRQAYQSQQQPPQNGVHAVGSMGSLPGDIPTRSTSSRGGNSWLRGHNGSMGGAGDGGSALDETSSVISLCDMGAEMAEGLPAGSTKQGVFVTGRVNDFELTGERGTKCPNLSIGQGDVKADVFVRFVFQYDKKSNGWRQAEKPLFDVQHLATKLKGNNVPMPSTLVKHLLRVFIPEIIQRRILPLFPKEFGEYMLTAQRGFDATADVAVVGPGLKVLDADLAFEVRGPARSSKEARKQQQKYAAAKEARSMLGLSLPQAQVLAELFGGRGALLDPPRPATIKNLIAFQAFWDRHPQLFDDICQVWNTAYQVVAHRLRGNSGEFNFRAFMDGAVTRVRRKPARARVIMRNLDVGVNADGVINMIHDYTQRTLEELFIKGPIANTRDNPEYHVESLDEQREVLNAWHSWMLRELDLFKSKFRGAAATLLGAGDVRGFSLGFENAFYEGPLRVRLPVAMQLDPDGAFSFELPLPSPEGNLSVFVDGFKSLVIPSHLRPPAQAINWIPLTGDSAIDQAMRRQVSGALEAIRGVLVELAERIAEQGLEAEDAEPDKVLSCPRTKVGDRLGRVIVNRLKVRVRLDERRIGEILHGIDSASMGPAFVSTAGRLLGHLGDVMTLGFTPMAPTDPAAADQPPTQYLLQFESSDISRLRADVQSLGFVSLVTPGGMVRLAHAVVKNFLLAFKGMTPEALEPLEERFRTWYANMSRAGLDISMCVDAKAGLTEGTGQCVVRLSGAADDEALRETSPLILVNDLDLVPLGKAMRGDPPASQQQQQQQHIIYPVVR